MGISLSAGEHQIEMRFEPEGARFGLLVSITAVLFLVLFLFLMGRGEKDRECFKRGERRKSAEPSTEKLSLRRRKPHGRSRRRVREGV